MTAALLPKPLTIPRPAAGFLVQHLGLPLGSLGAPFVEIGGDEAYRASVIQWWNSLGPAQHKLREALTALAAPVTVVDIQVLFQKSSLIRTCALTGSLEPGAPWWLLAHHETEDEYECQQVSDRQTLVNTFFAYLEAGVPVWEAEMRFKLPAPEFAVFFALADLYSRAQFASLITHSVAPAQYTLEHLQQAYRNATEIPDRRYLFPFAAELLPDGVRQLAPDDVQAIAGKLVERGLLSADSTGFSWTEPGQFLAESLHRRTCTLSIVAAGANAQGMVGAHCALFVRSDQPLWYFDLGRAATVEVITAGVSDKMARTLLDEILKPLGTPPTQNEIEAFKAAAAPPPAPASPKARKSPVRQSPPEAEEAPAVRSPQKPPAQTPPPPPPPPPAVSQVPPPMGQASQGVCPSCGKAVSPGAKFCKSCGSRLTQTATPLATPPAQPSPMPPEPGSFKGVTNAAPEPPRQHRVDQQPVQSPAHQHVEEQVLGVIPYLCKMKFFLPVKTYTLVVTDRRLIFARLTNEIRKAAVLESQRQGKAEGKGFFARWRDQFHAGTATHENYFRMPAEAIVNETRGNFAMDNASIYSVSIKKSSVSDTSDSYTNSKTVTRFTFESSMGKQQFQADGFSKERAELLAKVLGERVRIKGGLLGMFG